MGRVARVLCLALVCGSAGAADAPLPYAAYATFVRDIHAQWYVPRSDEFLAQSRQLVATVREECPGGGLAAMQSQWLSTAGAWERLSAVRGGALLARRSPREIDFMPTRPEAIIKAMRSDPADAQAMDRIGSPAKGLPALEWLMWAAPSMDGACTYALQVAAAVAAEADALQRAYGQALVHGWGGENAKQQDKDEAEYAMYEFLNLWDAGLQKLWWEEMDRPLQKAQPGRAAVFTRALSAHTLAGWRFQWQALRQLAVGEAPGAGPHLHAYLMAQGHGAEAARLLKEVDGADQAMAALEEPLDTNKGRARVAAAVAALKRVQQFAEGEMATALHFVISFFDEDGD